VNPQGSLQNSQEPTIDPYLEPNDFRPHLLPWLWNTALMLMDYHYRMCTLFKECACELFEFRITNWDYLIYVVYPLPRPKPSDFSGEKILSAPFFGGEVKPSVPCRKFMACKRTQTWRGSRHFQQNSRHFIAHSSTFRCWGSLASFQTWETPGGGGWNVLITGPPSWEFDVPLATGLCKNLPTENTQR